jgi:protocatechuate 3,4-dioxygenase beta subunit
MKRVAVFALLVVLLSLAVPAAAASGPLALTVTVSGRAGAPIAGARAELMAPALGTVASSVSDALGHATLTPAATATTYWVRVWTPGHTTVDRPWVPAADGARLTVTPTPLSGAVSGIVTDHLGLPVAGAKVSAWHKDLGLMAEASTDAQGAYTLNGLPVPGPYTLQVSALSFRPNVSQQPLPVTGGKT